MEETVEDLGRNSYRVIQPRKGFRFGMDSVLLAAFARVRKGERVADLCAGCGAISLMLAAREEKCAIDAVEIDEYMADMAKRNAELNGIADRMRVYARDIRLCAKTLGYGGHTLVVCNPPYFAGEGNIAKHLGELTLADVASAASALLKPRGRACFVYPAAGLNELCQALGSQRLEVKRLRCVCHSIESAPKIMLIEAVKNAAPGISWMPALITGVDSEEMRKIYNLEA